MIPTLALALAGLAAVWPGLEGDPPDFPRDPSRRLAAIVRLGFRGGTDTLRMVRPFVDDGDASVRMAAARILARAGDDNAFARLVANVSAPQAANRIEALTALREASALPLSARHAAERALADQDTAVRLVALEVLGAHPGGDSVPIVTGSLADTSREVRLAAIRLLGSSGDTRALLPLLERVDAPDRPERVAIIDALGALGGRADLSAGPALVRQLGDANDDVRAAAIDAVGRLRWGPAVPALRALAAPHQPTLLARRATLALGSIADPVAVEALVDLLREPAPGVEIVDALKRAGPVAVKPVAAILADAFSSSAVAATTVLGAIGDRMATAFLIRVLDARPAVAAAAARALGTLGDPAAVPGLMLAVADPRYAVAPSIREACLTALVAIRDDRAVAVVPTAAVDRDPGVRVAALHMAAVLGEGLSRENLAAGLADSNPSVRHAAIDAAAALPALRPAELLIKAAVRSRDATDPETQLISDALASVVSPADEPLVLATLMRPFGTAQSSQSGLSGPTRTLLLGALSALPSRKPLPASLEPLLLDALRAGGGVSRAAATLFAIRPMTPPTAKAAITLLPELEPATRGRLCPALAFFGSAEADAALVDLLDRDPDEGVRAAAAWAARQRRTNPRIVTALDRARASASAAVADNASQALRESSTENVSRAAPAGPSRSDAAPSSDRGWTGVRLLNAEREPVVGRWIHVSARATAVWAVTDDSGEARLSDLPHGPYRMTVKNADLAVAVR